MYEKILFFQGRIDRKKMKNKNFDYDYDYYY